MTCIRSAIILLRHRIQGYQAIVALFVLLTSAAASHGEDSKVRTDLYGDPLPPGAVARLGTVRLRHGDEVHALAFSPNGKLLASGSADRTLRLWDARTGKEVRLLTAKDDIFFCIAFSADGKMLASGSLDTTILLWDVSGLKRDLPTANFSAEALDACWADLQAADAARAYRSV